MLELLQARGRIGGPELARRLEVNERTVRRYAGMLREIGVPVEAERGRYGAYTLSPGFVLPPLMFTDDQALGFSLGLIAVRLLALAGVVPAAEGALAKLGRVMPGRARDRVRALEQTPPMGVAFTEAENGVVLRCSTSDLDWMARVLPGLGCPFVMKKAPELRQVLRQHARRLSALAAPEKEGHPRHDDGQGARPEPRPFVRCPGDGPPRLPGS